MSTNNSHPDLFGEEVRQPPTPKKAKVEHSRHIAFQEKDFKKIDSLLKDQGLRSLMPAQVKGKNNRMVIWCIQELIRLYRPRPDSGHQSALPFESAEVSDLRKEVDRLQQVVTSFQKTLEAAKESKSKWWRF